MFFKRNKASLNDNHHATSHAISLIAANMVIDGNIMSTGEVHIEGAVRGTVEAEVCGVGRGGSVEGTIRAQEVVVRGRVIGPIHSVHVDLEEGADVQGDIVNSTITVQSGAHLQGAVWHSDDPLGGGGLSKQPGSLLKSPLWPEGDDDAFRPLKVIKPR
jgi:cytoskeletal protein CcmA (bactofilin family)